MDEEKLTFFIEYASKLKGYEKGEAQLFLDRLFIAFGNKGIIEAEASLESPIKIDDNTKFCDLLWPRKVLIEMKKRGDSLDKHFTQAKAYWDNTYSNRTEYVILCNFDEFWIYNWNLQKDPLDKVPLLKLIEMWRSLAFLCPEKITPIFTNNYVEVTKEAANKVAKLYNSLVNKEIKKEIAQRFTLQCLVALFAEDTGLFPEKGFFLNLINDCLNGQSSYDLFTLLFERMNSKESATGGRFKGVRYFDGGLFSNINAVELTKDELNLLSEAGKHDWSKVQPSIFGNIFEDSLGKEERHALGAHYTYESDIMRIVEPTILRPWRERIEAAKTLKELMDIWHDLSNLKILDPACGSGNFLYISFRELKKLELDLLQKIIDNYPSAKLERLHSMISGSQFYGIDINPFAVELAKVTLSMAKKLESDGFNKFTKQHRLFESDDPLPFDNLDNNIICEDALFIDWPKADVIIGNPPFQSKNKMQEEFGPIYLDRLRTAFPYMPGLADYCVYWFRKAHDALQEGGRAGLVGTKTISQTNSRIGGLDYIISHNGTILEAVARMPWSGKAVVHVSIVNWIKGDAPSRKRKLAMQLGEKKDGPWKEYELYFIPSTLSPNADVTKARSLTINKNSGACYQGQIHGNKGFLLTPEERNELVKKEPRAEEVIFPYLTADELIGNIDSQPKRFAIDFQPRSTLPEVMAYPRTFSLIKEKVMPTMILNAEKEINAYKDAPKKVNARQKHLDKWWLFHRRREELIQRISNINRYIACGQVTKRQIFEFISSEIRPNAALIAFPLEDDYSFGVLQSTQHWEWFKANCSTLKGDFRYTIETVFNTFPWPQWNTLNIATPSFKKGGKSPIDLARAVARAARELRDVRNKIRAENNFSLRDLYRSLELPGANPLQDAQDKLDTAVWNAYLYGLPNDMKNEDPLEFLLQLNDICVIAEENNKPVLGPGLPPFCKESIGFHSDDCIKYTITDS